MPYAKIKRVDGRFATTGSNQSSLTITGFNAGSGYARCITLAVATTGASVSSSSLNGAQSFTSYTSRAGTGVRIQLLYLLNPTSLGPGSDSISVTISSSGPFVIFACSWEGVDQVSPFRGNTTGAGAGSTLNVTYASTTASDDFLLDAMAEAWSSSVEWVSPTQTASGQVEIGQNPGYATGGASGVLCAKSQKQYYLGSGSNAMGWVTDGTSTNKASIVASLRAAPSPTPGAVARMGVG